jgi:hypothetical protein
MTLKPPTAQHLLRIEVACQARHGFLRHLPRRAAA